MNSVRSIRALKEELFKMNDSFDGEKLFKQLRLSLASVEPMCFWNPEEYSRITIESNDSFELVLMCWEAGQQTPIYAHNAEEGWIYIIDGELTEEVFQYPDRGKLIQTLTRKLTNSSSALVARDVPVHRIRNESKSRAISLHIYTKPITSVEIYDEKSGTVIKSNLRND